MTDEKQPPKLEQDAPGLVWRERKIGWAATWQARSDLVKRGYVPKSARIWSGEQPDDIDRAHIATQCQQYQAEMLMWGRGATLPANAFKGTVRSLIQCYRTDPDSRFQKNRYHVRVNRESLLRRITVKHGDENLSDIKGRILLGWHREWSSGGKLATGSAIIGQLRALFSFGASLLEDPECERLCGVMRLLRFEGTKSRKVSISADHADAIRVKAREHFALPSIGLAQAIQFECTLRQKDVIGEWIPISEPGISAVTRTNEKWLRGIVWQEIDENLILRHVTSKKQKLMEADLKLAPMVMAELQAMVGKQPLVVVDEVTKKVTVNRHLLPASGPVVLCEMTGRPWANTEFRRKWRGIARSCGVPDNVWNMDSRSGAISEAIQAGAPMEFVRHAATHSDISQTSDYDREQAVSTAKVMRMRMENRNKPKTE